MKKQNYVTEETFIKEINQLDTKIGKVAIELIQTKEDVSEIKRTMATKQDLQAVQDKLISHIDFFAGRYRGIDLEQAAQAHHIKELRETSQRHEKRISALEHPRE